MKKTNILSVSRRTDIPAFYTRWFIQRIREKFCLVANPFNPKQIYQIVLTPQHYPIIVFWTRNPKPLLPYLSYLSDLGYQYYFLFTLVHYPKEIEPNRFPLSERIRLFQILAEQIGHEKVIWRYDPILISDLTPYSYHLEQFHRIAESLRGHTLRCILSFMTAYKKTWKRLEHLHLESFHYNKTQLSFQNIQELADFSQKILNISQRNGILMQTCAEEIQQNSPLPIPSGACIDGDYIQRVFFVPVNNKKDSGQRSACQCIAAVDIGSYNTCLYGCRYCYAVSSFIKAKERYKRLNFETPKLF